MTAPTDPDAIVVVPNSPYAVRYHRPSRRPETSACGRHVVPRRLGDLDDDVHPCEHCWPALASRPTQSAATVAGRLRRLDAVANATVRGARTA